LADGSAMFRRGLTGLLDGHPEVVVVGEATDAPQAVELARRLRPAVVVIDAEIPGGSEAAVDELGRQVPGVAILMLSSSGSMVEATRALSAGTSGYVLKQAEPELLVAAIIAAAHGYAVSPRPIMREIGRAGNPLNQHHLLLDGLSPREFEVLRDLAEGMTTKMLAKRLGISEKTVRNHVASMYAKLGLHDRSQLVRYAIQKGLTRPLELAR
ncbi:MAG: response regulator transcription factor, partial [Candidatus Dormibacteraceae bacterium]